MTVEDIIWRRTKLGLRLRPDEVESLRAYLGTSEVTAEERNAR